MSAADRHQQMPTPVRLPDDLKVALKSDAMANDRSLNGEVVARLRESFKPDGMTLRDFFAANALATVAAYGTDDMNTWAPEDFAEHAYAIADAMLKARAV